jgi:hypothetical protein
MAGRFAAARQGKKKMTAEKADLRRRLNGANAAVKSAA